MEDLRSQEQLGEILSGNRETVQKDLSRRLAKQEMASGLFSFLGYGPQAFLLKDVVQHDVLWVWLGVVIAAEMTNAAVCFFLQKSIDQPVRRQRLTWLLMITLLFSGTVWGSVILLPGVIDSQLTWSLQQVAIGIVALASTHALAAHPGCLAAFTLGILAPTALAGIFGAGIPLPFGIAAIGLFLMCQLYGLTTRKLVIESIAAELALRRAKEAAETANRAKSTFLSNMSHELRTPLNAILGYTQILSRQDNMTDNQQRQLGVMQASGEHLMTLIGDILDLSKIEAQKLEIINAPFALGKLLEQVIDIIRPRAQQKGLELRLEADASLPLWMVGDESRLRQILINLMANAVKFTQTGRVTLRAAYAANEGGTLCCEVADTGVGIPGDELEVIFQPFTQLARDAQGREGAGLGLPISRRLAGLMGGTLTVTSQVGRGSVFRLAIPLAATAPRAPATTLLEQAICGYLGERQNVLIVDDNPTNVALLADMLQPLGFAVRTATSGEEALRLALEAPPHLVLLDLVMPGLDGVETARELRRQSVLAGLRIIGVSATVTDSERRQAFAELCDAFVTKPVMLGALLEAIGRLLDLEWQTSGQLVPNTEGARLTAEMLAALPPELRTVLGDAALSLDGERIAALIPDIAAVDAGLARTLSGLVEHFDFQAILGAIGEEVA